MNTLYKNLIKPILFALDPHFVHESALKIGNLIGKSQKLKKLTREIFLYENSFLEQNVFGLNFKNPVGLSAGYDKKAQVVSIIPEFGFGFMSIGTITYRPHNGNPKPWVTRLIDQKSIAVNYGLQNMGSEATIKKLLTIPKPKNFPLFISIGKTKEEQLDGYINTFKAFTQENLGDVFEINISCPNIEGGELFSNPLELDKLLLEITTFNNSLQNTKQIVIKMPINLDFPTFKNLLDVIIKYKIEGVIIGNLNKKNVPAGIIGNLSGLPTQTLSNYLISETYKYCGHRLKIIGVGGIFSAEDAYKKIKLGSSLVQLITGMIFEGPTLIKEINENLVLLAKKDGFTRISDAIGSHWKV